MPAVPARGLSASSTALGPDSFPSTEAIHCPTMLSLLDANFGFFIPEWSLHFGLPGQLLAAAIQVSDSNTPRNVLDQ